LIGVLVKKDVNYTISVAFLEEEQKEDSGKSEDLRERHDRDG